MASHVREPQAPAHSRFTQNCISLCVDIGAAQLQHLRDFLHDVPERDEGKKHAMVQVECKDKGKGRGRWRRGALAGRVVSAQVSYEESRSTIFVVKEWRFAMLFKRL